MIFIHKIMVVLLYCDDAQPLFANSRVIRLCGFATIYKYLIKLWSQSQQYNKMTTLTVPEKVLDCFEFGRGGFLAPNAFAHC